MIHVAVVSNDNCVVEEIAVTLPLCFQENGYRQDNYHDEAEFVHELIKTNIYDIVFIDIDSNRKKGEDIVSEIRKFDSDEKVYIIFISSQTDNLSSLFTYHPFGFFEKPVTRERLIDSVNKMKFNSGTIMLTINRKKRKIYINDIKYIQSEAHKIGIYIDNMDKPLFCYAKISDFYAKIQEYSCDFLRVHTSYIINRNYVDEYLKNSIRIGEAHIPVSRKFNKEFKEW